MPGLRHAHTLQQLQQSCWILTPGRVFKHNENVQQHDMYHVTTNQPNISYQQTNNIP